MSTLTRMERDDRIAQLRKGVLELAILAILDGGPAYGGEVVERLSAYGGLATNAGTVYPLLSRLRKGEAVETYWEESPIGPPRKYYRLTAVGRDSLRAMTESWREMRTDLEALMEKVR